MVSGRLARSRKSGSGGPEVVSEKFDKELNREMNVSIVLIGLLRFSFDFL